MQLLEKCSAIAVLWFGRVREAIQLYFKVPSEQLFFSTFPLSAFCRPLVCFLLVCVVGPDVGPTKVNNNRSQTGCRPLSAICRPVYLILAQSYSKLSRFPLVLLACAEAMSAPSVPAPFPKPTTREKGAKNKNRGFTKNTPT